MKDRGALFVLLGVVLLATTQSGVAQSSNPSYRPPPKPATSSPSSPAPSPPPSYRPPPAQNASSPPSPTSSSTPASATTAPPAPAPSRAAPSSTAPATAASSTTPVVLTPPGLSVSILQSGGLAANADILAWLHGNLTLNTSIIVCARGLNQSTAACSPPCKLGAACYYQAFNQPLPDGSPLKLQIIDPGAKNVLVDTQIDSGKCTMILPCDLPVNNTTVYGKGASIRIALTSGCTIEVDPTTVQGGTPPALNSGQTLAPASTAVTYTGTLNDPTAGNPTTFKPGSVTQVYSSNLVDVQTAMEGLAADGSKCNASKNAETCNGITIHAHAIIAKPHFSQFFYKQAFDQNGNAQVIQMAGVGSQCGEPGTLPFCRQFRAGTFLCSSIPVPALTRPQTGESGLGPGRASPGKQREQP